MRKIIIILFILFSAMWLISLIYGFVWHFNHDNLTSMQVIKEIWHVYIIMFIGIMGLLTLKFTIKE